MPLHHAIRVIWIVLLFLPSIDAALGAEIGRKAGRDFDLIGLQGPIKSEDVATFRSVANASGKAVIVLDSTGGAALAGIEMGKLIHLKHFATFVPNDTLCASSCALMWLAGNPRLIAPGGVVGFHAVYITQDDGTLMTSGSGNALVGAYLNQLDFSGGHGRLCDARTAREDGVAQRGHGASDRSGRCLGGGRGKGERHIFASAFARHRGVA